MAVDPRSIQRAQKANPGGPTQGGYGQNQQAYPGGGLSPVVQQYQQWNQGRVSASLPRPSQVFDASTFGPGYPIIGPGINEPNDSDLTDPRRWEFQVNWNMPIGTPGSESGSAKLASFVNLRNICELYSVAQACINLRISEMRGLEWDIVPTADAEKAMRSSPSLHADFQARRAKALRFFKRPDSEYQDYSSWFAALLYEVLTVDALALYMWPTKAKNGGLLGSNLGELALIDGTTIKPLIDTYGNRPKPPNVAYQQYLYGVPRTDLMTLPDPDLIEESDDEAAIANYRTNQLLYLPFMPRVRTPYGLPPIERALVPAMAGLNRQQYQLDYFNEGSIPGVFVSPGDANMTLAQQRTLQDALNALAGDPAWKHKIIVLPPGSSVDPQKPASLADQFDEIVMTQVCMAFDVMPMELGIAPKVSTTQTPGAANQMAKASEAINTRKAFKPLLAWLKSCIFDNIIQNVCGQADMEWAWMGVEQGEDEETRLDVWKNKISIGLASIDEARVEYGLQPWGLPITSDPGILTMNGFVPLGAIDPSTGVPVGNQPTNFGEETAPAAGDSSGDGPADNGTTPAPKPKPAGSQQGVVRPAQNTTPGHTGANSGSAEAGRQVGAKPQPNTKAALAELDLLRRRLKQKRSIDDWDPENLPRGVLLAMQYDLALGVDPLTIVDKARKAVLEEHQQFRRREAALDQVQSDVASRLGKLANGLRAGRIAAPMFVSQGVKVMEDGIAAAYRIGAQHALADLGHPHEGMRKFVAPKPPENPDAATEDGSFAPDMDEGMGADDTENSTDDAELNTGLYDDEAYAQLHDALSSYWDTQAVEAADLTRHYLERFLKDMTASQALGVAMSEQYRARMDMYAHSAMRAYERAFGITSDAASQVASEVSGQPPVTLDDGTEVPAGTQIITWNISGGEICQLCADRDGQQYTLDTLPGYPGDGGFGEQCDGGPNCKCYLTYEDAANGASVAIMNTGGNSNAPMPDGSRERLNQLKDVKQTFVENLPAAEAARFQSAQDSEAQRQADMGAHQG